jgi:hypothetical protein
VTPGRQLEINLPVLFGEGGKEEEHGPSNQFKREHLVTETPGLSPYKVTEKDKYPVSPMLCCGAMVKNTLGSGLVEIHSRGLGQG